MMSASDGNPNRPFDDTTFPFTAMSNEPEGPTFSSASTPSASFSAAAARTALGW
jgi:hypothetical protein